MAYTALTSNASSPLEARGLLPSQKKPVGETPRRIAVFLDGCNFFYLQRDALHWFIDPKKLLGYIAKFGDIIDANYYTTVDPENDSQNGFLRALTHMGFRVETKPVNREDSFSNSVDLDMIVDLLVQINNYDMAIIISGDADFTRIVEVLRSRGKEFLVMGTKGTISSDLRNVAGMCYRDFADLRKEIEK